MATWPATLPQSLEAGSYNEEDSSVLIRTDMGVGPAKIRRRQTAKTVNITASLTLTEAQVETFQTFYDTTLAGGALEFTWTHPRTGASTDFRFIKPVSLMNMGLDIYRLNMALEILP